MTEIVKNCEGKPVEINIKITDFGFATVIDGENPTITLGSPNYMAPELCE